MSTSTIAVPELIWFVPTRAHMENPWQHIVTSTPNLRDSVANLWYTSQGGHADERVLIVNWKSKSAQNTFMRSPCYGTWCMPLLDLTTSSTAPGQFRFTTTSQAQPGQGLEITTVFNAPVTDFLYFDSELHVEVIKQYRDCLNVTGATVGFVGMAWGEYCQDEWSNVKLLLCVGWSNAGPIHDLNSDGFYHYLVTHSIKRKTRSLSFIPL